MSIQLNQFLMNTVDPWWLWGIKIAWWWLLGVVIGKGIRRVYRVYLKFKLARKTKELGRLLDTIQNITPPPSIYRFDREQCQEFIRRLMSHGQGASGEQLLALIHSLDRGLKLPCKPEVYQGEKSPMSKTTYTSIGKEVFGLDFGEDTLDFCLINQIVVILLCEELNVITDPSF